MCDSLATHARLDLAQWERRQPESLNMKGKSIMARTSDLWSSQIMWGPQGVMRNLHSTQQCIKEANWNYPHLCHSCGIANHTVTVSDKIENRGPIVRGDGSHFDSAFSDVLIHLLTVSRATFSWHFCVVYAYLKSCSRDCSVIFFLHLKWEKSSPITGMMCSSIMPHIQAEKPSELCGPSPQGCNTAA